MKNMFDENSEYKYKIYIYYILKYNYIILYNINTKYFDIGNYKWNCLTEI